MAGDPLPKLVKLMAHLRSPEGCPWDRAQDYDSVKGLLLEEAYEVIDALQQRDFGGVEEELGDLLFQVVFYSRLAEEDGKFDIDRVIEGVHAQLMRRHPHVFGGPAASPGGGWVGRWDAREQKGEGRGARAPQAPGPERMPWGAPATVVMRPWSVSSGRGGAADGAGLAAGVLSTLSWTCCGSPIWSA